MASLGASWGIYPDVSPEECMHQSAAHPVQDAYNQVLHDRLSNPCAPQSGHELLSQGELLPTAPIAIVQSRLAGPPARVKTREPASKEFCFTSCQFSVG